MWNTVINRNIQCPPHHFITHNDIMKSHFRLMLLWFDHTCIAELSLCNQVKRISQWSKPVGPSQIPPWSSRSVNAAVTLCTFCFYRDFNVQLHAYNSVCVTVLPSFRWAILTFLVWWTRFRPSILRTSDVWVGVVRADKRGRPRSPSLFFLFLCSDVYLMTLSRDLTSSGRQLAFFWSLLVSSKTPGRPLFLFVGRNVRTSSWLLWVLFNYSSSNWAVFFDSTIGFLWPKRADFVAIFPDVWTLTQRGHFSFVELGCWTVFSPIERAGPGLIPSLAFPHRFLLEVMGDTSERSKPPSLPPRCPCGFWG